MQIVTGLSAEHAILQSGLHVRQLYQGLFSHFFSTHRAVYSSKDCQWFLQLANKNVQWIVMNKKGTKANFDGHFTDQKVATSVMDPENRGCVPISVYKLYLTRILGKAEVGTAGINTSRSLTLYKEWVSKSWDV